MGVAKDVISPNKSLVDTLVVPEFPKNVGHLDQYVKDVCALSRRIFDPRVEQFNRTELTPTIALSQGLHRKPLFEQAMKMKLLTAGPVDAMVASALKVKPLVTDTNAWITLGSFSGAVGLGATVSTLFGLYEGDLILALSSGAAAVLSFMGAFFFFNKFSNLHKMYNPPIQPT